MGPTATRKQREIAEREKLIIETARAMLVERGYLGLTMDRIAEAIEYSKGTVYQHFRSKEDLIAALAAENHDTMSDFFERGATFNGKSRERVLGIGVAWHVFVRLFPTHIQSQQIIHAASINQKAGDEHLQAMRAHEARCFSTVMGVVRDAIAHGDLVLPEGADGATIPYGLWTMSYGGQLVESAGLVEDKGIADPAAATFFNYNALLDGYGWKPLSSEWDYAESRRRVLEEIFSEEARRLGLL